MRPAGIMSVLYALSVVLYSSAITMTASFSEEYLWVIFMGLIIVSSTLCSYMKGEWKFCKLKGHMVNAVAILFLCISMLASLV